MRAGWFAVVAATFMLFYGGVAMACDDHVGKCELEAWRGYKTGGYVTIEGSATCDAGRIVVRLYDGTKFLAIANGRVRAHAVEAIASNVPAYSDLKIKYSITPR